ncbi:MAG: hypothetical protein ACRDA5_03400, partial [Clostridium sp.]
MGLSKEEKINVILESFEVLLSNVDKNIIRCGVSIIKMSKYDVKIAEDMWMALLKITDKLVVTYEYSYKLTGSIVYGMKEAIGERLAYNIV